MFLLVVHTTTLMMMPLTATLAPPAAAKSAAALSKALPRPPPYSLPQAPSQAKSQSALDSLENRIIDGGQDQAREKSEWPFDARKMPFSGVMKRAGGRVYWDFPDEGPESAALADILSRLALRMLFEPLFRPATFPELVSTLTYSVYVTMLVVGSVVFLFGCFFLSIRVYHSVSEVAKEEPITLSFLCSIPGMRYINNHIKYHLFETPLQPLCRFAIFTGANSGASIFAVFSTEESMFSWLGRPLRWLGLISAAANSRSILFESDRKREGSLRQDSSTLHQSSPQALASQQHLKGKMTSKHAHGTLVPLQNKQSIRNQEKSAPESTKNIKKTPKRHSAPTTQTPSPVGIDEALVREPSHPPSPSSHEEISRSILQQPVPDSPLLHRTPCTENIATPEPRIAMRVPQLAVSELEESLVTEPSHYNLSTADWMADERAFVKALPKPARDSLFMVPGSDQSTSLLDGVEGMPKGTEAVSGRSREDLDRMRADWVRNMPLFDSNSAPINNTTSAVPSFNSPLGGGMPRRVQNGAESKLFKRLGSGAPRQSWREANSTSNDWPGLEESRLSRYFCRPSGAETFVQDEQLAAAPIPSTVFGNALNEIDQVSKRLQEGDLTPPPGFAGRRSMAMFGVQDRAQAIKSGAIEERQQQQQQQQPSARRQSAPIFDRRPSQPNFMERWTLAALEEEDSEQVVSSRDSSPGDLRSPKETIPEMWSWFADNETSGSQFSRMPLQPPSRPYSTDTWASQIDTEEAFGGSRSAGRATPKYSLRHGGIAQDMLYGGLFHTDYQPDCG